LQSKIDPDDIVQQTLARALERRDQFRGCDDAQRAAWLRTLLGNLLNDAFRKFARPGAVEHSLQSALEQSSARLEELLAADLTSPSERLDRQERLVRLADALARLSEDQRKAVELKHLQGLSLVEASRRMGRSVPAVAGLLQRGLKALRFDLEDSPGGKGEDR
jgi:RNA polymerase sigma-70 factor (ECF subfamily)